MSECLTCGAEYDADHLRPYLCDECRTKAEETGGLGAEIRAPPED